MKTANPNVQNVVNMRKERALVRLMQMLTSIRMKPRQTPILDTGERKIMEILFVREVWQARNMDDFEGEMEEEREERKRKIESEKFRAQDRKRWARRKRKNKTNTYRRS